jgi:hypothetical protein
MAVVRELREGSGRRSFCAGHSCPGTAGSFIPYRPLRIDRPFCELRCSSLWSMSRPRLQPTGKSEIRRLTGGSRVRPDQ